MKYHLILIVLVYVSSGDPLEGNQTIDGVKLNDTSPIKVVDSVEADSEEDKILEATGFFVIKQADGRWFIEVYKADTIRGTKILYCKLVFSFKVLLL